MFCPHCAARLVKNANYCHQCGNPLTGGGPGLDELSPPIPGTPPGVGAADPAPAGGVERPLWEGGFSAKGLAPSFTAVLAVTLALLIGSIAAFWHDRDGLAWAQLVAILLVWILQLLRVASRTLGTRYRLTNRRLFLEVGLLKRHKDQLDLERVEDVRIRQNLLDRLLDVGTIEILSTDRRLRRVLMESIDGADALAEQIRSLARGLQPASVPRPVAGQLS